ncbi:AP-3 complex subunit mu-1-like [Sycon ciliatum]|uniref:AP-3 complex subunit mu-1-like n=1 Tax=Sycon ciliatum TaxID=27933 RepID=UPI0020AE63E4|eukprot:scpid51303/ scgid19167/ AP-3 complex subunit mu-1; AP-3 adapter complex mu3A subunit; Adapter-related protein complex 3 mu-1 subunit; Mu-adaptin 3A; Mu3A-adaptin &gt; AP-3 complex subunit mu-1; AP-3 adapter complex mu3A subunit; Adapter-related protein complex 3 mu-1 subunit; Mu-adaptin 3A; Mu3A-adaptin
MIDSLFMINETGDVFMEKHWKSVVSRNVCDYFFEAQNKAAAPEDVPPVISTPHFYLISVYKNRVFFVAAISQEVPPLFVIEFLHRIMDTFKEYFGGCNELEIKDNFVIVYELLEEMLDNGFPLATELNVLKEMIRPPSMLRSAVDSVTGGSHVSSTLPTGQLSNVPWRRVGVKYANNEVYFDLIEEVHCIVDKTGTTIFAEIQGSVEVCCKLSGMPDLTLSFVNPRILDDVSFHPCVRFRRWEAERVLSFVPPDGNFRLMSYHITAQNIVALPIYVKPSFSFKEGQSGRIELTVGPKQTMGHVVEDVVVEVIMPKAVQSLSMHLAGAGGPHTYDPVSKVLRWEVGKIQLHRPVATLSGSATMQTGSAAPDSNPTTTVQFNLPSVAVSGLKVNRLDLYGEKYKPFKGVKYITRAGKYQIRA